MFDFSELVPYFGLEFTERVGTVFVTVVRNQTNPKAYYQRISIFSSGSHKRRLPGSRNG